jgi:GAF domain-containing protein
LIVYGWNQREGLCAATFAYRKIVGQVFQQGKPALVNVRSANSGEVAQPEAGARSTSVLATPLLSRDAICGVLYLERGEAVPAMTGDDLEFVAALSSYVVIVLDSAQKLEQLKAENRRMPAVKRISAW